MSTFRIVTTEGTVDVKGDAIISQRNSQGVLEFVTIVSINNVITALIPLDVLVYIVNLYYEDDPNAMTPKEKQCECQHD